MESFLNYPNMIDTAMRGVVMSALEHVSKHGLKDEHHFYISFSTTAFGVQMPEKVREKYPDELTIVLQHQFQDLVVEKNKFSVVLLFGGIPEKLVVPFKALTRFTDPSENFVLEFSSLDRLDLQDPISLSQIETNNKTELANVIPLDRFRDKNKK